MLELTRYGRRLWTMYNRMMELIGFPLVTQRTFIIILYENHNTKYDSISRTYSVSRKAIIKYQEEL